ncbi:MAG TPA: 2-oxoacid:acceptor oxidoreductase family protein [Anaerovoracaceae bacterium]|nr:2-oxoacid:acceptor oxidoreductase family protein [Anaerovoracaceae bacterium]
MSVKKIFIAGFGGQGVLLIGRMLSYAAMYEEKEVTWMPSYGPEMRGGTANCTVCISEDPIASPLASTCDVLVAMNGPSLDKFESMLLPGGDLFINSSIVTQKATRTDVNVYYVDCNKIAEEKVGNGKTANMVMLGAIIQITNVVGLDIMEKVFEYVMTGGKTALIALNMKALEAWTK